MFGGYYIDDAYITYTYAEHLVDGHGLVFNIGDALIEGYSNFLWLLVLSFCHIVGLMTPIAAKAVGIITMAATGLTWYFHFRSDNRRMLWLVSPLFLICPVTAFWAVSGLELGLHALLLLALVLTLLSRSRWAYLVLPLFLLSRPESPALAILLLVVLAVLDRRARELNFRYYAVALAIVVLTAAALTVFRLGVFGYPLPNTFYAKTHYDNNGIAELVRMLSWFLPLTLGFLWALFQLLKTRLNDRLLVVSIALFLAEAVISSGVDAVMNFWFRYMIPFMPFLLIAILTAAESVTVRAVRTVYLALVLISLVALTPWLYKFERYNATIIQSQERMITWAKNLPETTTISMTDMGRIPYETDAKYYDLWGLVDLDMGHKGFNGAWEFLKLPDFFVLVGYMKSTGPEVRFPRERNIAYTYHFPRCYTLVRTFSPDGRTSSDSAYSYLVFQRQPNARQLVESYGVDYWQRLLHGG